MAWNDERLDSLGEQMDAGFDRIDRDIRELRAITIRFGGGIMVGLLGVIFGLLGVIAAVITTG